MNTDLEVVIPPEVKIAAKRGFIRTTTQAYATSIPTGGIAVTTLIATIKDPDWIVIVATVIAVILSPFLAGLASYLDIMSKGIPEEYTGEATPLTLSELELPYSPKHSEYKEDIDSDVEHTDS